MTNLWSFDFGETTGIALGAYGPNKPYEFLTAWEVHYGLEGFIDWWRGLDIPVSTFDAVVAEKFVLNPGEINLSVPDLTGVPIEGALAALSPVPVVWQLRGIKTNVPDWILQDHGLWQTGLTVNHTDGRDANDAIIHALAYLHAIEHLPTLQEYFRN